MNFILHYVRHLSALAFIGGFALDYYFSPRIDNPYIPLLLGLYLLIAAASIIMQQYFERVPASRQPNQFLERIAPVFVQFVLGAVMSILFVYYSRSASIVGSWPFMVLLGAVFVGNEIFRERVRRFSFQLGIFFFVLFMTMVLCLPILLRAIGALPFLAAGGISLLFMSGFIGLIVLVARQEIKEHLIGLFGMLSAMYVCFNLLYFAHLIPPIPLVLKESGVYHEISRDANGDYRAVSENATPRGYLSAPNPVLHLTPRKPVYFYSAVFAPIAITTPIVHVWEWKDTRSGDWNVVGRIAFPITGGREGGYRGYTMKENLFAGKWRVSVETSAGELLGRSTFSIVRGESPAPLVETVLK